MRTRIYLTAGLAAVLTGCAMGPNYKRPEIQAPVHFRGAPAAVTEESLADTKWSALFQDEVLTELIATALKQSYDLQAASERVLQARAQMGVRRADYFPDISATGALNANRISQVGQNRFLPKGTNLDVAFTQAGLNLNWELDFWGRIRRLNEAARAQYFASEEARRGVTAMLVADVTSGYFTLRELDLELEIAKKTQEIAVNGLQLTKVREERGVATELDVQQAEQLLRTANAQIAASQRAIAQQENALSVLLGQNPGEIRRGKNLESLTAPARIPAGLPSALLTRRPDIREAEQNLISANAQIGAARAEYFPQISLTSFVGGQSRSLSDLFTGAARQWTFAPQAAMPIFNAGRVRSNVKYTEALQRESVANYNKTIQTAFREVSDSLVGYEKTAEQREQQTLLVKALAESSRLSNLRYEGGLDNYLQVLDAQRNQFQGDLVLAQLRGRELLSVVQLYRALGGGWEN